MNIITVKYYYYVFNRFRRINWFSSYIVFAVFNNFVLFSDTLSFKEVRVTNTLLLPETNGKGDDDVYNTATRVSSGHKDII